VIRYYASLKSVSGHFSPTSLSRSRLYSSLCYYNISTSSNYLENNSPHCQKQINQSKRCYNHEARGIGTTDIKSIGERSALCYLTEILHRSSQQNSNKSPDRNQNSHERNFSMKELVTQFCKLYLSLDEITIVPLRHTFSSQQERDEVRAKGTRIGIIKYLSSSFLNHLSKENQQVQTLEDIDDFYRLILAEVESSDIGLLFLIEFRSDLLSYQKLVEIKSHSSISTTLDDDNDDELTQIQKIHRMEHELAKILGVLFSPSLLELKQISYDKTPTAIIEYICRKEAVHPIQSLQDLKKRLSSSSTSSILSSTNHNEKKNLKCFAFFHPSLPDLPLVFVHVAFLTHIADSMQVIYHDNPDKVDDFSGITVANFYSITSTQNGLRGRKINLGKHLIQSVVNHILQNTNKKNGKALKFVTLSPLPKFRKWLEQKIHHSIITQEYNIFTHDEFLQIQNTFIKYNILPSSSSSISHQSDSYDDVVVEKDAVLKTLLQILQGKKPNNEYLNHNAWYKDTNITKIFKPIIMKQAATYLLHEKSSDKKQYQVQGEPETLFPMDPVANFHLGNGAKFHRLNWLADTSRKGIHQSFGVMVNYEYKFDSNDNEVEKNSMEFLQTGNIVQDDDIMKWLY